MRGWSGVRPRGWVRWLGERGGDVRLVDITGGHFEVVEKIGSSEDCISAHLLPWIEQLP